MPEEAVMSVTTRSKILTLSGTQCFAMLRAMATRENHLVREIQRADANREGEQIKSYLDTQLEDLRSVRATFSNTPFTDGGL